MKKSINIYKRIVEETDRGYLVVYHIDKEAETYEEVIRIDDSILQTEGDATPLVEFEIFDKIQDFLKPSMYFFVYRNAFGSDWFTRDLSDSSLKKTALPDAKNLC